MKTRIMPVLFSFLACFSCMATLTQAEPANVTMTQLIATPEKYEGQHVRVIGYLHLEFEGDVLYLHKEDFDHAILGNGIWVHIGDDQKKLSDNYVLLEGVFTAKKHGHMGMWSGELSDINRSMIWSSLREPRGQPSASPVKPSK